MNARPDRTRLAVLLIIGSMFSLAAMDALVKGMTDAFTLWQLCAARAAFSVPILLVVVAASGRARLRQLWRPWVVVRSLLFVGMWLAYYAALPLIDLSVAATALYTIPLFIAGFAALLAREPVGWRRWLGIAIGFAGVVVILRPGGEDFSFWALLPVLAAMLYALAAIVTRTKCSTESPFALALGLHTGLLLSGIAGTVVIALIGPDAIGPDSSNRFLLGQWVPMGLDEWAIMAAFGTALVVVTAGVAKAYQAGPSAIVGTFDYSYLVFASLWGVIFFGETLDALMIVGIAMIVAAGMLVLWQPRRPVAVTSSV
jgi:drug/metabolite transporter (DMT)-like permease